MANAAIQRNGGISHCRHLGNMQIKGTDTANHSNKYSNEFLMVTNHEIDTKFASQAHLVQKL